MSKSIKELCQAAYETAKEKGWHDKPATFGDRIALCHSELSEALEAYRERPDDGYTWSEFDPIYKSVTSGKLTRASTDYDGNTASLRLNKPEGVPAELADVCIRIFDICGLYGIDLQKAIEEKMAYNKTRPYRHGGKKL